MAIRTDFIEGKLRINWPGGYGFSEDYKFDTTDFSVAKTNFTTIINYRVQLLALDFEVAFASLSQQTIKGDSVVPVGYEVASKLNDIEAALGSPIVENCNNPQTGLMYRFANGQGGWVNRVFRGLRDSWVDNYVDLQTRTLYAPADPLATIVDGMTSADAVGSFVEAVRRLTSLFKKRKKILWASLTVPEWDVTAFETQANDGISFCRMAERDTGGGYSVSRGRRKATI